MIEESVHRIIGSSDHRFKYAEKNLGANEPMDR